MKYEIDQTDPYDVWQPKYDALAAEIKRLQAQRAEARLNWKLCEDQLLALRARLAEARKALTAIMRAVKTPPFTDMSRTDMREIAGAAIAAQEDKT